MTAQALKYEASASEAPVLDTAKRQQILEGARRVFLREGFDGASIGDIVRAAGVSKGTVYAYFPGKEKLFEALVIEDRRKQAEVLFTLDEGDRDVARVLTKLGETFLKMLVSEESLAFLRMVVGASAKFPEIGRAYFDAGPCYGSARLGAYFEKLTSQGLLKVDVPQHAAKQFLDLCKTGIHLRLILGDGKQPEPAEIAANIDSAVRVFLAAYGTVSLKG
jgi:AcrR family transcriptional regulator